MRGSADIRMAALLFVAAWLSAVFVGPGPTFSNPNTISRVGLVHSLIDAGSLKIDQFATLTVDRAEHDGHFYLDKAPGQALVALPFIMAAHEAARALHYPTDPLSRDASGMPFYSPEIGKAFTPFWQASVWIAAAFTTAAFGAAAVAALYLVCRNLGISREGALLAAILLAIGTPAFGWSTVVFSHAMAGGCVMLAFAASVFGTDGQPGRPIFALGLLAGAAIGLAILTEFTAAVPALLIAVTALWRMGRLPRRTGLHLIAGTLAAGLPFALLLGVYNQAAFGSPTSLGYSNVVGWDGMKQGFFGISFPQPWRLLMIVAGPRKGLVWLAPIVLLTPLAWRAAIQHLPRAICVSVIGIPLAYFLLNAGYYYWDGGYSTGPRHSIAGLPFLCLGFAPLWDAAGASMRRAMLVLAGIGIAISVMTASVTMAARDDILFPFFADLLPRFFRGDVHNLLAAAGLNGLASLLGLGVIWLAATAAALSLSARGTGHARSDAMA